MSAKEHENYYVPEQSKLPIMMAVALGLSAYGAGTFFNTWSDPNAERVSIYLIAGVALIFATMFIWFSTVIREDHEGLVSNQLRQSYVWGMGWFIFSEVMFFAAFFGALYYVRNMSVPWLAGEGEKGVASMLWEGFSSTWPITSNPDNELFPAPKDFISPWGLPLLNTILLVLSSITIHIAHNALKAGNRVALKRWMVITLVLGFAFVGFQAEEYVVAYQQLDLTLRSGIYGSTFFMLTGFHGFHVCMGAIMILIMFPAGVEGALYPGESLRF